MCARGRSLVRRWSSHSGGATVIEMAILAPVFLTALVGVLQLGWAFHCAATMRWALETSARALLISPTTTESQLRSAVADRVEAASGVRTVTVALVRDNGVARATAVYRHPLDLPLVPRVNLRFRAETVVPLA